MSLEIIQYFLTVTFNRNSKQTQSSNSLATKGNLKTSQEFFKDNNSPSLYCLEIFNKREWVLCLLPSLPYPFVHACVCKFEVPQVKTIQEGPSSRLRSTHAGLSEDYLGETEYAKAPQVSFSDSHFSIKVSLRPIGKLDPFPS